MLLIQTHIRFNENDAIPCHMEALLRGLLLCMWELSNFYELSVHDVTVIINYLFSLIIKNQDRIFNKKKKKESRSYNVIQN